MEPIDTSYRFTETQDWFSFNIDHWKTLFPLVKSPNPRVLEIGSWEGRSAVFLLTQLCGKEGEIVCIDHFDLMKTEAGRERYAKITHNLTLTGYPFRVIDEFSVPGLMKVLEEEMSVTNPGFDWLYVDGSHEADDTFLDGELAWRLAKRGAIIIFDDYLWPNEPSESMHHPKRGIDAFMQLHEGEYTVLSSPTQYQKILQKTAEMRIGFLVKEKGEAGLQDALGYGINIALAIDSAYAMPAAVTIRSAVVNTPGRITFYVFNLGLTEDDKVKIESSIPSRGDVTLLFVEPQSSGDDTGHLVKRAKIDMIDVLPVQRILYLDADIIVRKSLKPLWDVDLHGNPIGAVTDIGFPMGHDATHKIPYFNAGVLLMDLAKIRRDLSKLKEIAEKTLETRFPDQDILNAHFENCWMPLALTWNAQGLGTYANYRSPERDALDITDFADPAVVHFTGPVNPGMEDVLYLYTQPYTAKPWGYAGAPGHPYAEEWWNILEDTAWKGWRTSENYRKYREQQKGKAIKVAIEKFSGKIGLGDDM